MYFYDIQGYFTTKKNIEGFDPDNTSEQQSTGQPSEEHPRQEQPRQEQSRDEQPREEQPREEQSRDEQPRQEQPRDEQPREEQSRDGQPREEQSRDGQPREEQSRDGQPRNGQPREGQSRDGEPREGELTSESNSERITSENGTINVNSTISNVLNRENILQSLSGMNNIKKDESKVGDLEIYYCISGLCLTRNQMGKFSELNEIIENKNTQ